MRTIVSFVFTLILISCTSNSAKSEPILIPSSKETTLIEEIQFLKDSGFLLSAEMELQSFPTKSRVYQEKRKFYDVSLSASNSSGMPIKQRSFYIDLELNEKFLPTLGGREKNFYFLEGKIKSILNAEPMYPIVEDGRAFDIALTGIGFRYNDGNLSEVACYYHFDPCDEKILLTSAGEIQKVIKEKKTCKKGCGNLIFFRAPGFYKIADNKVRVRKEPSVKSEIITELNKDTPIEVIADAEVYEEVFPHYGTWGKVKLEDGTEGYVYGAFLRAPAEPDVVAIREKAEVWKKKNAWKGK
ncbi:SH3 domain-containing protein [Leptospira bandrabouensis]|uniref:SH3 domain-containing protein n=1 Tax=Leptospira bandrabouensis TaxID=2484903 RepID=UPI001EE8293D|nr:SH3 domain-containing protein [Leptospira bandrabouensis]MCG6144516.1 SH3 domain-containing protein [Leptospira bandrabouensis]MCG6160177.1 SH3 domain-containing protein [Leptospira bandrabouensis]MCG6164110.1 SH3 domain-containing protein [Leptospira bandrabouensis]